MARVKAQHSSETVRWGTPDNIVTKARNVMGGLDLDPCSEARFNAIVGASKYYSLEERSENGLELSWAGTVFLNPPGQLVKEFWRKAMSEPITQMIWVGFSVEQLSLLADEEHHPMDFSFCILRKRLKFKRHDGYSGSPSHSNYVCGYKVNHSKFVEEFAPIGRIYQLSRNK